MKGYLSLSNGQHFSGIWQGTASSVLGEIVFFTGMTGYEEVLTDPSYKGQVVVFSYPLIGNYGISKEHFESKNIQVSGVILSECYTGRTNNGEQLLSELLAQENIPVLTGVDTRAVIQAIREQGTMQAFLGTMKMKLDLFDSQNFHVSKVSVNEPETYGNGPFHVVLIDFGYKKAMVTSLVSLECKVTIVPYHWGIKEISGIHPDGILFSNGPGDPKDLHTYLSTYRMLAEHYPCMGICLGHQILALAFGGNTEKLKFGHRGANHPVMNVRTKSVSMSSQNHSYVVMESSLQQTGFEVLYQNVNDGSVEGLIHRALPVFSVQFHPEASPGPREHLELFSHFISLMKQEKKVTQYA